MPISILMSKIIFMKYLPPVRSKLVPKLKMLRIYWNLAHLIFKHVDLNLNVKNIFIKYLPPVRPKLVPKLKMLIIYWNLVHKIFQIYQFRVQCQNWFLWNTYQLLDQINPKIKIAQKFMLDILSIPISTTISDESFIEHSPQVMPKLVPEFEFQSQL